MIGLLDCNNFYVSCERLFNPKLSNGPVIVLSNNDGCVISRSNEAKLMGIKMGEPFFKIKNLVKEKKIKVLSSNYSFYGDISNRIMRILKKNCFNLEVYSIDEAFFNLDGINRKEFFCDDLVAKIFKYTGIPVSIGIAKTKTLSKIANRAIKRRNDYPSLKFEYKNVLQINSEEKLIYILRKTNVKNVWGIGKELSNFLNKIKIINALQLSKINEGFIRQKKGINIHRTILELKGIVCYGVKSTLATKKTICVSRSFGNKLISHKEIRNALIVYVQKAVQKMIGYRLLCKSVSIFLQTSIYDRKKYKNLDSYFFTEATTDLRAIWKISDLLLEKIYRKSFLYSKVGVILSDLCKKNQVQASLFNNKYINSNTKKRDSDKKLMEIIYIINKKFGDGKLRLSSDQSSYFNLGKNIEERKKTNWRMKSDYCSPCYTTRWCDIPKVKV